MTDEKRYNGWTNYETWNVALWMGNEQGSQEYVEEQARECYRSATDRGTGRDRAEEAAVALADSLKDEYEEAMTELLENAKLTSSVWADLLGAALSEVNWLEIAEHYINDVKEDIDAEEPEKE